LGFPVSEVATPLCRISHVNTHYRCQHHAQILDRAEEMVEGCSSYVPVEENPGLVLGTILGVLANHGRDKVAIVASPGLSALGAWLEQLLAESTGKAGKGIIPVDREVVGTPDVYGADRVFVYVRLQSEPEPSQDAAVEGLVCAAAFS
jgi:hypothetical protein